MIDEKRLEKVRAPQRVGAREAVAAMSVDEMESYRYEIDQRLPPKSLDDINLVHELLTQFAQVKALQELVNTDKLTPANQKSQVAGQVVNTLQQLIKMQDEHHNAERFKAIEQLMVKAIKKLPKEAAEGFIREYEEMAA